MNTLHEVKLSSKLLFKIHLDQGLAKYGAQSMFV